MDTQDNFWYRIINGHNKKTQYHLQKYRKVLSKLQQTFADHTAKFGKRYRNPFADDTTNFCEQYFVGF